MMFLWICLAGIFGTTAMVLVMGLGHGLRLANADMVRAVGGIYTGTFDNSLVPGLFIHYSAGILFSFAYALFIGMAPIASPSVTLFLATAIGLGHGIVIGLLLITEITEFHPVAKFRKAGFDVAIAHLVGHVAYGFTVGMVLVLTKTQTNDLWVQLRDESGSAFGEVLGFMPLWIVLFAAPSFFILYTVGGFLWEKSKADAGASVTVKKKRRI